MIYAKRYCMRYVGMENLLMSLRQDMAAIYSTSEKRRDEFVINVMDISAVERSNL